MLRTAFFGFVLAGLLAGTTASAQTKPATKAGTTKGRPATSATARPQPAPPATKSATDGQGEYVAPGMSGAPDEKVTTDYNNQPLKKPATGTSTMSSQPKATPAPRRSN
ncbi:hypothetical protein J0X19_20190 [Hymenobacter sp. BT186]|uniref:Uncharacterized protein n=1 Tax=Hymenobacter telluris TaxID=2816474 RepID=A0A939F034_9BACT|nr:hypothetical protein [Hymenobacter telluris]MBO0360291.1 hypothetical protein [Hymenobacter telluris]MBW3376318.1 hypothetical protein [Hymenobacter norwichensis]